MRRVMGILAAVSMVMMLVAGCSGVKAPAEKKAVTLMLNWVPYGEHAPFYYGVEKGIFAAEGIDLTIQPGGGSGKTVQAVGQGQVQFGWADTPAVIQGIANGVAVKSVGAYLQIGPGAVQFYTEKGFSKPADLKGKSIGMTPGDAVSKTFEVFLTVNGMSINDVKVVAVDSAGKIPALIEGKVDAIIGFFHDQAPTIEARSGKKVGVLRFADFGVNTLGTGLIVHADLAKKDPALVKAMVRAVSKSFEEAAKDTAGAAEAMSKKAEKAPDKDVLKNQLEKTLTLLNSPNTKGKKPGVNAEADWQATIDLLVKTGMVAKAGKPADYVDLSIAQ